MIDSKFLLFLARFPAALFPVIHPLGDAVHDVLGVGVQHDAAWALERIQGFNRSHHFHAIVGGLGFAAMQRLAVLAGNQQRTPATRARITSAGAVGIDLNSWGQNGCVKLDSWFRPARLRPSAYVAKPASPALAC